MGPRSSMGSPVTFMIRPRVPRPTGIVMGAPVSVALVPRTRPSVPKSNHQFCKWQFLQRSQLTVHGNTSDNVLTQMLLRLISEITYNSTSAVRTATSRVNLLPPLSVVKALRMEGSWSVSNLTVVQYQRLRPLNDCRRPEKFSTTTGGPRTIDNGTNDGMDLAILRRVGGCESRAQGGQKVLLDGLEGANGRRAAEVGACAQNPAKFIISAILPSSIGIRPSQTHLFSIL
jgi:hypothetical protein